MSMRCPSCQQSETLIWAHNGGVDTHRWDATDDEQDCSCDPQVICTSCDSPVIREHGFVVLDSACFGHGSQTLQ